LSNQNRSGLGARTLFALWGGDRAALSQFLKVLAAVSAARAGPQQLPRVVIVVRLPGTTAAQLITTVSEVAPLIRHAGAEFGANVGGPERGMPLPSLLSQLSEIEIDWLQVPERAAQGQWHPRDSTRVLRSCHDIAGVQRALANGADACTLSPIWPTPSKLGHPGLGLEVLRQATKRWPGQIVALGGLDAARARVAFSAGAAGVAALSAPWKTAAEALVASLNG